MTLIFKLKKKKNHPSIESNWSFFFPKGGPFPPLPKKKMHFRGSCDLTDICSNFYLGRGFIIKKKKQARKKREIQKERRREEQFMTSQKKNKKNNVGSFITVENILYPKCPLPAGNESSVRTLVLLLQVLVRNGELCKQTGNI